MKYVETKENQSGASV